DPDGPPRPSGRRADRVGGPAAAPRGAREGVVTRPTTLPERFRTVLVEGLVTGAAGRPGAPAEPSRLALSRGAAEAPAAGHSLAERTVVAALSGGLDSVALLHLLRFEAGAPLRLVAAHFDHAMRAES